jgi:hypothetical protein
MPTHFDSVFTVLMLFFFGLVSPGPKFLVVVEATLNFGRAAGLVTGLGAALGDAVYARIGLFCGTQLTRVGPLITGIEFAGERNRRSSACLVRPCVFLGSASRETDLVTFSEPLITAWGF